MGQPHQKPYESLGWGGSPEEFWVAFLFVCFVNEKAELSVGWQNSLYPL